MTRRKWFDSWCAAECAAMQAIRKAARQSLLTLQRGAGLPGDAETRKLRRERDQAQALFRLAMSAMREPMSRRV
jgi:hypothetical protein